MMSLLNLNVGVNLGALLIFPSTTLYRWVPALLVVTVIIVGIKVLLRIRASAMCALAHRLGFQYGDVHRNSRCVPDAAVRNQRRPSWPEW